MIMRTGILMTSAAAIAILLGACSDAAEAPSKASDENTLTVEAEQAPVTRATKDEITANFEEALELANATTGPGEPALWTLADDDTTIYLFGTVHLLRPELEWRSDRFETAFNAADKIVFEVDMKSEEAQKSLMTDFMARGMFQDGRNLRGVLNEDDEAVISAAFDSAGVPLDAMNAFEPWMASVNLGVMQLMKDGFDPSSGVEEVIGAEAAANGKSFGYLETISQQADAFDLMPEDEQITMLYETALMLGESSQMLDVLVGEWADGDVAGIASLVASPDGVGFTDAAYEALLTDRNKKWVPQIEDMLDEPGTTFIAVGAGHLAGPDSVVKMLRDKGYEITGP
jgi:uncharacterized protein YbaP (TraB family)